MNFFEELLFKSDIFERSAKSEFIQFRLDCLVKTLIQSRRILLINKKIRFYKPLKNLIRLSAVLKYFWI